MAVTCEAGSRQLPGVEAPCRKGDGRWSSVDQAPATTLSWLLGSQTGQTPIPDDEELLNGGAA